jgi:hypothetical protein
MVSRHAKTQLSFGWSYAHLSQALNVMQGFGKSADSNQGVSNE